MDPKSAQIEKVTDELDQPNGIVFRRTIRGLCRRYRVGRETKVFDVDSNNKLRNGKPLFNS